jgi:2-C-methyl-D-erythritol 4-phosphate cytidylyltransferase
MKVKITEGAARNIKITNKEDLIIAEALMSSEIKICG